MLKSLRMCEPLGSLLLWRKSSRGFVLGPGCKWSCQRSLRSRSCFHQLFLVSKWVCGGRSWLENEGNFFLLFSSNWEVAKSECMQQRIQWAHSLLACVPSGSLMKYSVCPKIWDIRCFPRLPKWGYSACIRHSQLWARAFCEHPTCLRMSVIML